MNKAFTIVIITVAAVGAAAGIFFLKKSADGAKEKSDDILKQFKAIDESLQKSKQLYDSIHSGLKDSLEVK